MKHIQSSIRHWLEITQGRRESLVGLGMMAFIKLEDRSNLKGEQPGTRLFRQLMNNLAKEV